MKRPAFQFYPKDWRDEQSLRLCSMAARGLWIDLMCLMHSADRYGHLELAGKPMAVEQIARLVGESAKDVKRWMAELVTNGVCSVTEEGVIFSRRMVRDEAIREKRAAGGEAGSTHGHKGAEHGGKGGRPRSEEGGKKPPFREPEEPPNKPPPAFASASATAEPPEVSLRSTSAPAVAAATGADASQGQTRKAELWRRGRALLLQSGVAEATAGEFVGSLVRDYGQVLVLDAIADAEQATPADPRAWLVARCQERRASGREAGDAWWSSDAKIDAKGRSLGMMPRAGESWAQYRDRIAECIAERKRAA